MTKPPTSSHSALMLSVNSTAIDPASIGTTGESWLQLLPAGTVQGRDGRGPYLVGDAAAMSSIVRATEARAGSTELVIDYDHQTVFGAVPGVGGRAPASGWMKQIEVRPDGIFARVQWTAAAAAAIKAGEYRYISPVFFYDQAGNVQAIVSAGLTNTPNFDLAGAVAARSLLPTDDGAPMKSIAKALGLAEDASEDTILAAVNSALLSQATLARVAEAAGKKDARGDELVLAVQSASVAARPDPAKFVPVEQLVAVQSQLNVLTKTVTEDKAANAVAAAMTAGKIAPALKDWALAYASSDPAKFAEFVAGAPVIVAPGGSTAARGNPPATKGGELTDSELAVCRAMGLKPEDFKKTRDAEA